MITKGQKIDGRYQIIRTIGEGGMANVYLAYDTILDREVAVKVLRGDLANDEKFVKRFQREAKAASSLNHPNIVEMYDVGEDDGNYFIVMEFVDGKTLKSLIKKRGALSLSEVVDIMLQLTSGIACAHDSYIIHRDIKPQNVLILEDGRVKITDFGIAIALNSTELTQTNSVMGSVHYLPPEQANGSGATIKSDIYSLGILMYELLIGKLPFKGENAVEIAIKHMKDQIPSVSEQNAIIPQSIENVIIRACAKNPKNRYDSVAEMHDDLKTVLSPERSNEERYVYRYAEHELEDTKTLPNLSKINETKEEVKEEAPVMATKNEKKKNKKLKIAVIVSGIICALLILAFAIFAIVSVTSSKKETITLPDIENKTREAAEEKLEGLGLIVDIQLEASETIEEGKVIGYRNAKASITKVKKDSTVVVIVSTGVGGYLLEDYKGRNIDVVELELEGEGLQVVRTPRKMSKEEEDDETIFEGMIVGQDKEAGTRLQDGGVIELYYATLIVTYPDFTDGKYNVDKIQVFCDDNGITCQFVTEEVTDKATGTILAQNRSEGVEVKPGVTLKITVAEKKIINYTVTFDSNGGSVVSNQTVVEGSTVTKPATPTKEGYNFAGWYNGTNSYDFTKKVTSNLTLVAKWDEA